jgi:hypothetical protein
MENIESGEVVKIGTNPLVTLMLYAAIITGLVMTGTHFSQRHAARALEDAMADTATAVASINR